MFIFKIVMIGLKKILLRKNKGRQTMHHQQLFLQAFAELYQRELWKFTFERKSCILDRC